MDLGNILSGVATGVNVYQDEKEKKNLMAQQIEQNNMRTQSMAMQLQQQQQAMQEADQKRSIQNLYDSYRRRGARGLNQEVTANTALQNMFGGAVTFEDLDTNSPSDIAKIKSEIGKELGMDPAKVGDSELNTFGRHFVFATDSSGERKPVNMLVLSNATGDNNTLKGLADSYAMQKMKQQAQQAQAAKDMAQAGYYSGILGSKEKIAKTEAQSEERIAKAKAEAIKEAAKTKAEAPSKIPTKERAIPPSVINRLLDNVQGEDWYKGADSTLRSKIISYITKYGEYPRISEKQGSGVFDRGTYQIDTNAQPQGGERPDLPQGQITSTVDQDYKDQSPSKGVLLPKELVGAKGLPPRPEQSQKIEQRIESLMKKNPNLDPNRARQVVEEAAARGEL